MTKFFESDQRYFKNIKEFAAFLIKDWEYADKEEKFDEEN